MKKLFSLILVSLTLSVFAPAAEARLLTDSERILLQGSSRFLELATKAVENYANFRANDDGVSAPYGGAIGDLAEFIKRAKDKQLGVNILKTGVNDPLIAYRFMQLSKAKDYGDLAAAPTTADDIIDEWIADNTFEEFASAYFDIIGDGLDMTIGGN